MIYIVNGFPGCGKTTFEKLCQSTLDPYCQILSTIDFVKTIARGCGWDGTKNAKNRKFLSDLKDLLTEWDDVPFKQIVKRIEDVKSVTESFGQDPEKLTFFIDCREPDEIEKICKNLGAKSILIRRYDAEIQTQSNHADSNIFDYTYDYIIDNNGSLTDLRMAAESFILEEKLYSPLYEKRSD